MTAAKPTDIFQPGDVLNNTYRIETILGRGGTSEVYQARSEISGRVMAIKALKLEFASNEDFLVLMTREEDIRDVRHDAVVRYLDTQRMPDGVVYLVMDHIDGPGMDRKLADGGMSAHDLLIVGQRVCEGLIATHARNIVHRDLSPDNIILRDNDPAEAVIIDFGIAKDTNPGAQTIVGNEFAGKYAYAPPEQLSGNTDHRSDIYSLGALLLATYRGAKPEIGKNPLEMVQLKSSTLDVEGVPEPLRSLIAKMCDPDPDARFQTAEDLLAAFKDPSTVDTAPAPAMADDDLSDATVIVPRAAKDAAAQDPEPEAAPAILSPPTAAPTPPTSAAKTADPPKPAPTPEPAKKRGGMLMPVLGLAVVGAVGAGVYFSGILTGPSYPVADPFTLTVQRSPNGATRATGHVPSPEIQAALTADLDAVGGTTETTLASGDIPEDWGMGVLDAVDSVLPLDEFQMAITGTDIALSGLAPSAQAREAIETSFAAGFPGGLTGTTDIGLGPRFLQPAALEPYLDQHTDCGPLQLRSPPPVGYGLEDSVLVTGRFAQDATRAALQNSLAALAGDRPVRIEAEILNPSLCTIDALLPKVRPGGYDIRLGYGDRDGDNPSGRYTVGENPTIDVKLPEGDDSGYLWVSVVDVKGVVFHLLPNRLRADNSLAALRPDADADGYVRLAFGIAEADGRLAFTVDGATLGKSQILAMHTDALLFEDLRPTTESVASFADALDAARNAGGYVVTSLDSALLTTEE